MKSYGVNHKYDQDCCPGHSRFSRDTYKSKLSKRAQTRDTKIAHRIERHKIRSEIKQNLNLIED